MRKHEELYDPQSCLNKAKTGEMLFVLRSKDEAAPATIRQWVKERISMGLNRLEDKKIFNALECARIMEEERTHWQLHKDYDKPVEIEKPGEVSSGSLESN